MAERHEDRYLLLKGVSETDYENLLDDIDVTLGVPYRSYKAEQVKIQLNAEQKLIRKRKYRRDYRRRPSVQEKLRRQNMDPILIERRRTYAAQPHVKLKKKRTAKVRRRILRIIQEEQPALFDKYRPAALKQILDLEELTAGARDLQAIANEEKEKGNLCPTSAEEKDKEDQ
jgi:hypothetical protein